MKCMKWLMTVSGVLKHHEACNLLDATGSPSHFEKLPELSFWHGCLLAKCKCKNHEKNMFLSQMKDDESKKPCGKRIYCTKKTSQNLQKHCHWVDSGDLPCVMWLLCLWSFKFQFDAVQKVTCHGHQRVPPTAPAAQQQRMAATEGANPQETFQAETQSRTVFRRKNIKNLQGHINSHQLHRKSSSFM